MSEPRCHFGHRGFSSGQQCVHCDYQEPHLDNYKEDLKRELDRFLDTFAVVSQDGKFKSVYIDSEELENFKSSLYYMDVIEFIQDFTRCLNPNLKRK